LVDLSDLQVSRKVVVAAPPEHVYDLVSDVTRIGELSPACKAAWWDEGSGPRVGGWFTGRNESPERGTWERHCEVIVAEPARAFGWIAGGREEGVAEWIYRFRPLDGGTEVEESWRISRIVGRLNEFSDEQFRTMMAMTESSIEATLANLKVVAES
jgi:Polyketide cyclase / dehydrase and lipid transport